VRCTRLHRLPRPYMFDEKFEEIARKNDKRKYDVLLIRVVSVLITHLLVVRDSMSRASIQTLTLT